MAIAQRLYARIQLLVAAAACLLLSACGGDKFVKPVAASIDPDVTHSSASRYKDGYLRVFVTSNLDDAGSLLDFGSGADRPAKLLITARFDRGTIASFGADAEPEIPVLLYDLQSNSVESSVVDNALLTSGVLIDPSSLSRSPHLQIIVRGVPPDKARWVTNLLAASAPVSQVGLSFIPGAATFNPITYKLGDMLSEEIKTAGKPWEERTLLGLRADEDVAKLDGRQFIVLLNPTSMELEAPPQLARCRKTGAVTGLCWSDGSPWVPDRAYVRFELDVSDYRSIKDFVGADVSCEYSERNWLDYRSLIASGQLARQQTDYELMLMRRGDLLMQIRRGLSEQSNQAYVAKVLLYAQQFAMLPSPNDAYWIDHYSERASSLDACIRDQALRGQSAYAAIWDGALPIFRRTAFYASWADRLRESVEPDSTLLRDVERELAQIEQLLAYQELQQLRDGSALVALTQPQQQLERMLVAAYAELQRQIERSGDTALLRLARYQALADAAASCRLCTELLRPQIDSLNAQLQAIEPLPSRPDADADAGSEQTLAPATAPPALLAPE